MSRDDVIARLRDHEAALRAAWVVSASLFGSTARGEAEPSDVDIAVRLNEGFSTGGLDYFWRREQLRKNLSDILGCPVDVAEEPARKPQLQQAIDRDRALAF